MYYSVRSLELLVEGSLNGRELVLGDLRVEADLGLCPSVHAHRVHLPGILGES